MQLTPPRRRMLDPIVMPQQSNEAPDTRITCADQRRIGLCNSRDYRARTPRTCLTEPLPADLSGSGYACSASSTKGIHASA